MGENEQSPWRLSIDFPTSFHSLGLHLPDEKRGEYLTWVARETWPGGTDFQRETFLSFYGDIAKDAASGGAFYSGFCIAGTEDDRITTASLLARLDPLQEPDATVSVAGISEFLASNPACEVAKVSTPCGPGVLAITGIEWESPESEQQSAAVLQLARADLHVPVPVMGQLLLMSLTTPSLNEFPDYVGVLSAIAESISLVHVPPERSNGDQEKTIAQSVQDDFG